jgi:predicted LPLAT superfamily acyltransferase
MAFRGSVKGPGGPRPLTTEIPTATGRPGPWRATSSGPAWGLRFLEYMFARLPIRAAYLLVIGLAPIWFAHYNRPRYGVVRAMRRMGLRFPWWRALGAYVSYTLTLVDRWYVRAGRLTPRLDAGGHAALDRALEDPSGLVLLGSHCGSLEVAGALLASQPRPVRAVAVPDPAARQLLDGVGDPSRTVGGDRSAIVADGSVRAGLRLLSALRRGEVVAIKADRHLPGAPPADKMLVPLFGEPVELPRGPAEVVRLTGARAYAVSVFRTGPGCYSVLGEQIDVSSRDSRRILEGYAGILERHLAARPDQWFNFFPFWPRDARELQHHPEIVPPGMRAGARGLRGALLAALVVALTGMAGVGSAMLAGLEGGLLAALLGMTLGAQVDVDGVRNAEARATAVLGPILAAGLPLVASPELGLMTLGKAVLALVAGAAATFVGRRAG